MTVLWKCMIFRNTPIFYITTIIIIIIIIVKLFMPISTSRSGQSLVMFTNFDRSLPQYIIILYDREQS